MDVEHERCAGLDVHKRMVVAGMIVSMQGEEPYRETRTFGTMTIDLLDLSDWLMGFGVTHVAMESKGEYWKPIVILPIPCPNYSSHQRKQHQNDLYDTFLHALSSFGACLFSLFFRGFHPV